MRCVCWLLRSSRGARGFRNLSPLYSVIFHRALVVIRWSDQWTHLNYHCTSTLRSSSPRVCQLIQRSVQGTERGCGGGREQFLMIFRTPSGLLIMYELCWSYCLVKVVWSQIGCRWSGHTQSGLVVCGDSDFGVCWLLLRYEDLRTIIGMDINSIR